MSSTEEPVVLTLDQDQALVLWEWVVAFDETEAAPAMNSAERLVLWALEARLDRIVVAPFKPDFRELLDAARKRVVAAKIDLDYLAGEDGSDR